MSLKSKMTDFRGKKIAILGWGVDTKDVASYLLENKARITVFDRKEYLEIDKDDRIEWRLGNDEFENLTSFDIIVRNPAVYRYRKEIIEAEKAGVKVTSKTKIFFDLCPAKIIGVTGTKGKGTTTTLIYEIFKAAKKDAYIGGNIGLGVFEFLPKLNQNSWVVLELSSFQLIDLHKSPHIAVVLMTTKEHQDWHVSEEEYLAAKTNIVKFQTKDDFAVINDDYDNSRKIGEIGKGQKYYFSRRHKIDQGCFVKDGEIVCPDVETGPAPSLHINTANIGLRGDHNLENIMAASLASKLAGVSDQIIQKTTYIFKGLEHRLEEVGTIDGITYYNDSFSTVPETTIAAIRSFAEPLILIVGGSEKGSDFSELGETIAKSSNIKAVILIGLMTDRIEKSIQVAYNTGDKTRRARIILGCKDMNEIMTAVSQITQKGDVVLLSPGCASFDMFENYKERGEQFKNWVKTQRMKIHFMGIGGAGQSAIARIAKAYGFEVNGCDLEDSRTVYELKKEGIPVSIGHSDEHLKKIDILAHTTAVFDQNNNHPEYAKAYAKKIGLTGEEFMAKFLMKDKFVIAVSGTHGKGTTSSMLSLILEKVGFDPTCEIGANLIDWGRKNYRTGKSKYFICEADEFRDKFLLYKANAVIITSIEMDHPEYFKDLEALTSSFYKFVRQMKEPRLLVINKQDRGCLGLVKNLKKAGFKGKIIWYGKDARKIKMKLPGEHIIDDASAALVMAKALGVPEKAIKETLSNYSGLVRRFEYRGVFNGVKIYDDYAHHPTAVALNIEAAKKLYPKNRLWAVLQPHMFSRLDTMFDEFVGSVKKADRVVVTDVFTRRETSPGKHSGKDLAMSIGAPKAAYVGGGTDNISNFLKRNGQKGDVMLLMGAGDIYKVSEMLLQNQRPK